MFPIFHRRNSRRSFQRPKLSLPWTRLASLIYRQYLLLLISYVLAVQLELHVYNPQHKLLEYMKSKGITPQAYSPLGSSNSPLLADADVVTIAQHHHLEPANVLLGYLRKINADIFLSHFLIVVLGSGKRNRSSTQIRYTCPYNLQSFRCCQGTWDSHEGWHWAVGQHCRCWKTKKVLSIWLRNGSSLIVHFAFHALCRLITPPWRAYFILWLRSHVHGLLDARDLAVDLGFDHWPKLL